MQKIRSSRHHPSLFHQCPSFHRRGRLVLLTARGWSLAPGRFARSWDRGRQDYASVLASRRRQEYCRWVPLGRWCGPDVGSMIFRKPPALSLVGEAGVRVVNYTVVFLARLCKIVQRSGELISYADEKSVLPIVTNLSPTGNIFHIYSQHSKNTKSRRYVEFTGTEEHKPRPVSTPVWCCGLHIPHVENNIAHVKDR